MMYVHKSTRICGPTRIEHQSKTDNKKSKVILHLKFVEPIFEKSELWLSTLP